jgi:hypothetical protein
MQWEGRRTVLGLAQRLGERFRVDRRRLEALQSVLDPGAGGLVGSDMAVADDPEIELAASWRDATGCAAAPITGVARLTAAAVSRVRRVGEVGSSICSVSST